MTPPISKPSSPMTAAPLPHPSAGKSSDTGVAKPTGIPVATETLGSIESGKPRDSKVLGPAIKVGITALKVADKVAAGAPIGEALGSGVGGAIGSIPGAAAISTTLDGVGIEEGSVENTLGTVVLNTAMSTAAAAAEGGLAGAALETVSVALGKGVLAKLAVGALGSLAVGAAAAVGPLIEHLPAFLPGSDGRRSGRTSSDRIADAASGRATDCEKLARPEVSYEEEWVDNNGDGEFDGIETKKVVTPKIWEYCKE